MIPLRAFQRLFGLRQSLELTVQPSNPTLTAIAMDDARAALRVERRLRPKEPDNFGLLTSDTFLDLYRQATTGIFTILIGVVSLSLVVGGIVIMNIMLMVVSERTREIGLAQIARGEASRHPVADPDRVDHPLHVRRHDRHRHSGSPRRGWSAS